MILDGQQRLTSLYQAFYGVGEYLYYLRLEPLIDGAEIDDEDVLFHVLPTAKRGWQAKVVKRYADRKNQAEDLVLPLSILAGGKNSFYRWLDKVCEVVEDREATAELRDKLLGVQDRVLDIDGYKFPVVLLSDKTRRRRMPIFETLTGRSQLSVFDLLALDFADSQAREMWASAPRQRLADFEIDPTTSQTSPLRLRCHLQRRRCSLRQQGR